MSDLTFDEKCEFLIYHGWDVYATGSYYYYSGDYYYFSKNDIVFNDIDEAIEYEVGDE